MGSVGEESIEARLLRRLEEQIQSTFDRLNEDNKILKENNKKLGEVVEGGRIYYLFIEVNSRGCYLTCAGREIYAKIGFCFGT